MPGGGGGERPLLLLALSSGLEVKLLVLLMRLRMGKVVGGGSVEVSLWFDIGLYLLYDTNGRLCVEKY